jgi:hypothetical protein
MLMSVIADASTVPLRAAAARQLQADFEEELTFISPVISSCTLNLQFTEERLRAVISSSVPAVSNQPKSDSPPNAEILKIPITRENIGDFVHALGSSALIVRVAAFIYHLQPEALHLGREMMFLFSLLTEESVRQLAGFIQGLLHDAAAGKLNPFIRAPGLGQQPAVKD